MEPIEDLASKLEAKTASFVKEHRLPGAAVGVVHGDTLAWSAGLGSADIASRRGADISTLYRIASITKTFTVDPDEVSWRPTLLPTEDPNVFVVAPGVRESGERVRFIRRSDGRVTSMFLAVSTMVRFGPVGTG